MGYFDLIYFSNINLVCVTSKLSYSSNKLLSHKTKVCFAELETRNTVCSKCKVNCWKNINHLKKDNFGSNFVSIRCGLDTSLFLCLLRFLAGCVVKSTSKII